MAEYPDANPADWAGHTPFGPIGHTSFDVDAGDEVEVLLGDRCDAEPRPATHRGWSPGVGRPPTLSESVTYHYQRHIDEFDAMREKARKYDEIARIILAEGDGRIDCGIAIRMTREVLNHG